MTARFSAVTVTECLRPSVLQSLPGRVTRHGLSSRTRSICFASVSLVLIVTVHLPFAFSLKQGRRWVFGARGSILEWGLRDGSSPAEETLQIVHVGKVFCASHVVAKRRLLDYPRCFIGGTKGVKFSPQICVNLTDASDHGWGVWTPGPSWPALAARRLLLKR